MKLSRGNCSRPPSPRKQRNRTPIKLSHLHRGSCLLSHAHAVRPATVPWRVGGKACGQEHGTGASPRKDPSHTVCGLRAHVHGLWAVPWGSSGPHVGQVLLWVGAVLSPQLRGSVLERPRPPASYLPPHPGPQEGICPRARLSPDHGPAGCARRFRPCPASMWSVCSLLSCGGTRCSK